MKKYSLPERYVMRIWGSNAHLLQQSIHLNKLSRFSTLKHDIKSYQYHFIILLKTKELPQIKHTRKEFIHKVIYHLAYIIEISIWNMIWIVQIFWFAKKLLLFDYVHRYDLVLNSKYQM